MKKKILFGIASMLIAGTINAQSVTNGGFTGSTGYIGNGGVASPWVKGCAANTLSDITANNPEIISDNGNNVLELEGYYSPYQGGASFDLETAAQNIGPIPAGSYTVTFDARNRLQSIGNPGLRLMITLKNFSGCSWLTNHQNPQEIAEYIEIPLVYNFNSYSATFCIPQHLHNELSYLEFSAIQQPSSSTYCNGVIDIDNVTFSPQQFTTHFEYQVDCLTGKVQVRPTTPMNPDLHDVYIIIENNPNDPNNQNGIGDTQFTSQWFTYSSNPQQWYTISTPLEQGKNYYIKRGVWGDCLPWNEHREYNVELTPDQFDASFTFEINCNEMLEPILSVTGANQNGKNPHHMFTLYRHFPGTSNPDQAIETVGWWQQSNAGNYQYQQGPFTFNHVLDPNADYYVKRGVWNACTPWSETRRYDINPEVCDPGEVCDIYITELGADCYDGCGIGKWLNEFQINPNSTCYNAIDYVVFNTVNNHPFGPTFTDNSAPYVVPYCTSGDFNVTATIHFVNGTTAIASYYKPSCNSSVFKSADTEATLESDVISLYPNPASEVLFIETTREFDAVQLYSMDGKLIDTYTSTSVNVEKLESGAYLLKIVKGENVLSTQRFIKE